MNIISKKGKIGLVQFKLSGFFINDQMGWITMWGEMLYKRHQLGECIVSTHSNNLHLVDLAESFSWRFLKIFLSEKKQDLVWEKKLQYRLLEIYYKKLIKINDEIVKDSRKTAQYLLEEDVVVRNFVTILQKELGEYK
jgi:hypothetical protein